MTTMSVPNEPGLPRSWWSRNWKWVVPVGVIVPLLLCGTCIIGLTTVVFGALRSADVTKQAVARAEADPQVVAQLGQPITLGFMVTGSINITGSTGKADLSIPISGPKGKATVSALASRGGGVWTFSKLDVTPEGGGPPIDLLAPR